jgi:16S rRNA (adenine1518-N6/adenine1519-N6)-dimethyltransferase
VRTPYGQNFLVSVPAAQHIAEALHSSTGDRVIEIGPGRGALTVHVLPLCHHLTVVELDRTLADLLIRRWGHEPKLSVVSDDFMNWPLPSGSEGKFKVIGNLPYSAAAAIVQKVLAWTGWDRAVFMVQKEVALRMTASPGGKAWGLLALSVQSRARARRLFDVAPGAFRPPPKIVSTVLELERLPSPRAAHLDAFFKIAHAAFGQRRKTLANSLSHGLGMDRAKIEEELKNLGIDPSRRAETLTIEEYDRISLRLG